MRGASKVTFVVCRDGYRAIVDNTLKKGFNPLSVAHIAKTIGVYRKSEPGKDIKESHFRGDVHLLGGSSEKQHILEGGAVSLADVVTEGLLILQGGHKAPVECPLSFRTRDPS
ncbi:hypothetical protein MTO96_045848 [Rhipicephalus appendiculatus]